MREGKLLRLEALILEAEKLDDLELDLATRYYEMLCHCFTGSQERAVERADEFCRRSTGRSDLANRLVGLNAPSSVYSFRGLSLARIGRDREARLSLERGREIAQETDDAVARAIYDSNAASAAELVGDAARALSHGQRAVEVAERLGLPNLLGIGYCGLARAFLVAGCAQDALEASEQAIEQGVPSTRYAAHFSRAEALIELDRPQEALAAADASIAAFNRVGGSLPCGECHVARARAILHARGASAATEVEAALSDATELIEATNYRLFEPRTCLVRAELAAAQGDKAARERHLREAHRLYTEMGAVGHAERVGRELPQFAKRS